MDVDKVLGEALASNEGVRRLRFELGRARELETAAAAYASSIEAWLRDLEAAPATRWPDSKAEERVAQGSHAALSEVLTLSMTIHHAHKAARTRCAYCGDTSNGARWCGACNPDV